MALHIADYLIVRDDEGSFADFELIEDVGELIRIDDQVRTFRFTLSSHAAVGDTGMLSYVLDGIPFDGELDIEYKILINDHRVEQSRIKSTMLRGLWGAVSGNWLNQPPEENEIVFQLVNRRSNGGNLRFKNIVVWYQRSVAEP